MTFGLVGGGFPLGISEIGSVPNPPTRTVTFDGPTKRIILSTPTVSAPEIWSAWVDWVKENSQWPMAFSLVGGIALGGGLFIPPYFFLMNGWKIRPMEADHTLTISGNVFVDGGVGDPIVPTLGTFNVLVKMVVPVQAQGISTAGSDLSLAQIEGSSVLAKEATVLTRASQISVDNIQVTGGGLTSNQATMLLEMYELLGLDPTKPLIVTDTYRAAGGITQTIGTTPTETIVSRT